ncbi:MAG: glycoside hydrolase family 105 protein [Bryobacteraceae bacterium]
MKRWRRLLLFVLAAVPFATAENHLETWRVVADRLITTPPESYPWNWGEGVQLIGLMKVHERTAEAPYADYVERWLSRYASEDLPRFLRDGGGEAKVRPGYCGLWSPATAAALLYESGKKAGHLRMAVQVTGYIERVAERSPEYALGHWQGSHQLWVDTLYMACPLLSTVGRLQQRPRLIEDAASQIIVYTRYLQDRRRGLFFHMWDWDTGQRTADLWGRGNGWVLMSIADTIEAMQKSDAHYATLSSIAARMARGLVEFQTADGLWRTVLDDGTSYPEVSASAMIAYGLLKLVRLGVLPVDFRDPAQAAWKTINRQWVKDGVVTGVSAGTEPKDRGYYRAIPLGRQTWGTGAYLLAGSEVDRAPKPSPLLRR